jgi:serine protease Do
MKIHLKIFLLLAFVPTQLLFAQTQTTGLTGTQVADRNKPGVVMVLAEFKATVSVPILMANMNAIQNLRIEVEKMALLGKIRDDERFQVFLNTYLQNLGSYLFVTDQVETKTVTINPMGSGFVISPNGYIATNCHVVDMDAQTLNNKLALEAMREFIDDDIKGIKDGGQTLTPEQEEQIRQADVKLLAQNMRVSNLTKTYSIRYNMGAGNNKVVARIVPATVVIKGNPIPGKDVAILKAQLNEITASNMVKMATSTMPTVPIGDDTHMRAGDPIFVLGYPGAATYHSLLSEETMTEATFTQGVVSARKNMKDGWQVLQIDAAITHGNSGGPVFNNQGEVIGLATFGSIDFNTGLEIQGLNFVVPVSILKEFLAKSSIVPTMDYASKIYREGLYEYDRQYYKRALEKFEEAQTNSIMFPYIDGYIADCKTAIADGKSKEPRYTMPILSGGGLALILIIIMVRRRKRKAA